MLLKNPKNNNKKPEHTYTHKNPTTPTKQKTSFKLSKTLHSDKNEFQMLVINSFKSPKHIQTAKKKMEVAFQVPTHSSQRK